MVGKLKVVTAFRPRVFACLINPLGVDWSLTTTASPPNNCPASRNKPAFNRSAKKLTELKDATPNATASTNKRNSPARASRHSVRHARCHQAAPWCGVGCGSVITFLSLSLSLSLNSSLNLKFSFNFALHLKPSARFACSKESVCW